MLYMNKAMEKVVSTQIIESYDNEINSILGKIVEKTKRIQDSVIYDEDKINESAIDFERIFKFVGNWTGYEISCNEIRIEKSNLSFNYYVPFVTTLHKMLKNKYTDKKFIVYLCLNENYVEVRFHTHRENEELWLNENLNVYSQPILCVR